MDVRGKKNFQIRVLLKDLLIQLQTVLSGKSKIISFHIQKALFCPTGKGIMGIGQEDTQRFSQGL